MKKEKKGLFSLFKKKKDVLPSAAFDELMVETGEEAPAPVPPIVIIDEYKTYKVTGMQHYMDNIMELAMPNIIYDSTKKELIEDGWTEEKIWENNFCPKRVELIPEPDNPQDSKAIKVVVDGMHVGYIKSGSCSHLLKVIKEGRIDDICCEMGGGKYKYVSEDYDYEKDKIVYELEKDSAPYFVHLKIKEKENA